MNFRVPPTPRRPLAFHHQGFLFCGHRLPRWFHPTFHLRKISVRSSSFSAASSNRGGGGGREGNFLLIPGATMATLLMFGFLHARRMYDDRKVQDMRQRGIELEFSPDAKAAFLRLLPLRSISRLWGNLISVEIPAWSRPFIYKAWARAFHCDLDEASLPLEKYASLQDFFVRSLKEGTRPIDQDPKSMVSPVDGKVLRLGELKGTGSMIEQVKGFSYSAVSLLGANSTIHEAANEDGNKKYPLQISEDSSKISWWHVSFASPKVRNPVTSPKKGIYYCVIYLNPGDYHRVHSPTDWKILSRRHFSGHLYPTNERAVRTIRNLYIENERVVLEGQWNEGFLAIAAIGATNVGSIKLLIEPELRTNRPSTKLLPSGALEERVYDPLGIGLTVKKGEEIAVFNMGSTVVLVFQAPVSELSESNCILDFKFSVGVGDRIRVGEAIGRWGNS